jgi:uridine kinase
MSYINILGVSGSGKTSYIQNNKFKKNVTFDAYLKYTPKLLKYSANEILYVYYYYNNLSFIESNFKKKLIKLNRLDRLRYKYSFKNKLVIHNFVNSNLDILKNDIILDEGILSFIDNFFINPFFINDDFNYKSILDNLNYLPSKVIYLKIDESIFLNRYSSRKDKPWKIDDNEIIKSFYQKSLVMYDKYLNYLNSNYKIDIEVIENL